MILEEETKAKFGYYSWDWKAGSHKKIIAQCDLCGKIRVLGKRDYHALCCSCVHKGLVHSLETRRKLSESHKGKKFTEEHRRNLSKVRKGCVLSKEARLNMAKAQKGRHHSVETKQKIREANKGHKMAEESRRKISGKNNYNWQGGKSFGKYCERFNLNFKEEIRKRYGRKCYFCGKTEKENEQRLSVHHLDRDKEQGCNGKHWFVIPLCRTCHARLHADERLMRKKKRQKKNKVLYLQKSLL